MKQNPIFSLFDISNSIHNLNKKTESTLGLSLVQWCLLKQLVDMPGTSANLLSKTVGIHPSTLTQTLKRLEKKKFIFIGIDPSDTRKKIISITRLGNETMVNSSKRLENWASELIKIQMDLKLIRDYLKSQAIRNL